MHRKSQEAADALNNDDSCNSDRDDTQSKSSDISISNISIKKGKSDDTLYGTPTGVGTAVIPTGTSLKHEKHEKLETTTRHSVTPTSSSSSTITIGCGMPKVTISPSIATTSPPPPPPHHHLTTVESKGLAKGELPMITSTPHSHYHPDTDAEAFRWVDYRDPISFIRCDIYHNKTYRLYAFFIDLIIHLSFNMDIGKYFVIKTKCC